MTKTPEELGFIGIKLRVDIEKKDLEKVIGRERGIYENQVFVDSKSKYAKILRACNVSYGKEPSDYRISVGLVTHHLSSQGIVFIENAEIAYRNQETPFVVHPRFLDFKKDSKNNYLLWIISPGLYSEEFTKLSGGTCLYKHL